MSKSRERETKMAELLEQAREDQRARLRLQIEAALARQASAGGDETAALTFLDDLGKLAQWRGAEFMYARGIAESLRVGEEIFELAYAIKRAGR